MKRIHLTADTDTWTGASTTALLCARADADAIVFSAGCDAIVQRLEKGGAEVVRVPFGGWFAALNLSRALRHVAGDSFEIYVHSPSARKAAEGALKLVGRKEPVRLMDERPMPDFPAVAVAAPAAGEEPLLMWLGNITAGCGLKELIEQLGSRADRPWRLRVVGQGPAKIVSPILQRSRALGIDRRIEWVGYSANPYEQMNGVSHGIVADPQSVVAREFAAAGIPVITNISEIL